MSDFRIVETEERVGGTEFVTRFYLRAHRRCRQLNKQKKVAFYRYEIQRVNRRWEVVVMKNLVEFI